MIKKNLYQKTILPILIVMIVGFIPSFYFIDKSVTETVLKSTNKIIKNDITYIKNTIELKYKILFFISNRSQDSYNNNVHTTKRKIVELLDTYFTNSNKILFISNAQGNIPASKIHLNNSDMLKVVQSDAKEISLGSDSYAVRHVDFHPFSWKIYYLYNLQEQNNAIFNERVIVVSTIALFMITVFITLLLLFKNYVNRPNAILLEYFKNIADGKYDSIEEKFDVIELDLLIDNVNAVGQDIEKRENKIKQSLKEAENNSVYINNILNTQKSIIITKNAHEEITSVNKAFFKYFSMFKDLDDFKKSHSTITDFFMEEKGFIHIFENKSWIDEILNDQQATHRVKLDIYGNIYFFTIDLVKSEEYGHTLITLTDITNLENQKVTLDQYDKIINKSLMVSRTDLDGKILYVNDELLRTTKYSKQELIGKNEALLRSPDTPIKFYENMQKIVEKDKIWSGQVEKIDKNGDKFYVHLYLSPIFDVNHKIVEYMYLRHNITDLITAQQKAKNAEQSKSIFLASMSHEIRTPLNAIIGFTKILVKSKIENKYKHYVKTIDKSAENLLSILNDVLDISKIENNSLVLEKTEFNPFEEFNATVNLFYAKFRDKQINVECFIDPKIPQTIVGDALRIKQVLSNLISNAVKFTDDKGVIAIRADLVKKDDKSCSINFSVKDSGIGIPKDKQAHIFTPFAQANDSTTRVFGGTGLGLDICSKIVKLHNSDIKLDSQVGIGSKFSFIIEFNIKEDNSITSQIENLKTCIVKFPNHQTQYKNLKEYISSATKNIIVNDTNNIELLKQQDIVFISEDSIDEKVKNLSKNGVRFAIFSTKLDVKFDMENYASLSSPVDISQLFNVLIETINGTTPTKVEDNGEQLTKYKGTVLIAEDHEINQELISILLEMRGLEYVIANDGIEAMQEYKKDNFDLVLMDINMPKQNGIEATCSIRKYEKEQDLVKTPIIALTANALEDSKKQMLESGMDGHLLKPIDEKELDKIFRKYLKKSKKKEDEEVANKVEDKKTEDKKVANKVEDKKTENTQNSHERETYTIELASSSMGIAKEAISKIVKNFAKNIDGDMQKLKSGLDTKDFKEIANVAHKIKGATLNLKMNEAGNIASRLEKAGLENSDENIHDDFEKLLEEVNSLKQYIGTL